MKDDSEFDSQLSPILLATINCFLISPFLLPISRLLLEFVSKAWLDI